LAVSAIGSADEVEKDVVLGDGEQRPVANGPAVRRVVETDQANFAHIGVTHPWTSLSFKKKAWGRVEAAYHLPSSLCQVARDKYVGDAVEKWARGPG
jgi:hypothetical protein